MTQMSRSRALMSALALALVLAACGGDGNDTETTDEPTDDVDGAADESDDAGDESDDAGGDEEAAPEADTEDVDWPTQDITLLLRGSPGGGHDAFGQAFAQALEQELGDGANVIVDHMPGAAGVVAADFMEQQEPDGHIIHLMEPGGLYGVYMAEDADWTPADFQHELIANVTQRPTTFAVPADGEIQDWDDFVSRAENEELLWAITAVGSTHFLNTMMVVEELGLTAPQLVPHDGSAEAFTSLLRGDTQFATFAADSVAGEVAGGEINAIMTFSEEPLDILPDVPTGSDVGLEQFDGVLADMLTLTVPLGMDDALLSRIRETSMAALESEWMTDWAAESDRLLAPNDHERTQQMLDEVADLYERNRHILEEYID